MVNRLPEIDEAVTWRRTGGWVHRVLAGKVVLAARGGQHRELSGGASIVWIVLDEPGTVEEISDRVTEALGLTVDHALLRDAVGQMADAGLIEHKLHHPSVGRGG